MGPLIRLDSTLTDLKVLSDHLHQFMSIAHSNGLGEFQQDNATSHTSRIATYWLQEHSSEFRHFRWPPKSPDMNISEMPCNMLFRRDLHPLLFLLFYGQPCRIHGVNYLQHYFRH
ncbi:transposable element Tcb2 transposase [Trichonephila clavipes]|nr:transposable element Tcb2 transposase [Trichonephila clavipes]